MDSPLVVGNVSLVIKLIQPEEGVTAKAYEPSNCIGFIVKVKEINL